MGSVIDVQPQYPVEVFAYGNIDGKMTPWMRALNGENGKTTVVDAREMTDISGAYRKKLMNGDAIINLTIPMIVSEKPGLEFTPTFDYLEEICQPVRGVISIQFLLDAGGGAVGQDIVHLPVDSLQIDGCLFILLV